MLARALPNIKWLIRANNKHSKRCVAARSAILVQCAIGTLHTAELGFYPLQSRAHDLHDVIGQHKSQRLSHVWAASIGLSLLAAKSTR